MGYFAKRGASWGDKADTWWPAVVATLGGVLALAGPYFGQLSDSSFWQGFGLIVGIIGVLAGAVLHVFETFKHKAELKEAAEALDKAVEDAADRETEAEIRARENYLLLIDWTLGPITKKLAEVLAHKRSSRRFDSAAAELKTQILSSAKEVVGAEPTHVRANYFSLEWLSSGRAVLRAAGSTAHPPRDHFSEESEEGKQVFDMLARNGSLFCDDVVENPPPGWDTSKVRPYRTFISVTVQCDSEPVGMLTVDARDPGDLDEGDVALIKLLGVILAISESQRPQA